MIKLKDIIQEGIYDSELSRRIKDLEATLLHKYPQLDELDLTLRPAGDLHISSIVVKEGKRRAGIGSKVMEEIKEFADKYNLVVTLSPNPMPGYKKKLSDFYKNLGFYHNRGRRKDYRYASFFGPTMVRKPGMNEKLEKVDYPMIKIGGGPVYKEGPPDWTKFKVGGYYEDGDVHRYVLSQHKDFEDDDRIVGDFKLVERRPSSIPESEYWIDDNWVKELSKSSQPFPPIVVDRNSRIIDGGHRLAAAILRGDKTIKVFHQI